MRYLGDIVIVEHIGKNITSNVIAIPDDVRSKCGGIMARVVALGHVPPHRRKKKHHYPQDELKVGDVVVVTEQFGTRGRIKDNPNAIIYDSEDVHAIISEA